MLVCCGLVRVVLSCVGLRDFGLVWFGLVVGLVWFDFCLIWCGVVWLGLVWFGVMLL